MPKAKITWMKHPDYSNEDFKIHDWCIDNNIIISPMGINGSEKYRVGVSMYDHRTVNTDKFEYDQDQVWDKVREYERYYYDKYSKETKRDSSI